MTLVTYTLRIMVRRTDVDPVPLGAFCSPHRSFYKVQSALIYRVDDRKIGMHPRLTERDQRRGRRQRHIRRSRVFR